MSINRCTEIRALLLPYLHGEAARSERTLVHAHLGLCRDCQNELESLQQAEALLSRGLSTYAAVSAAPAKAWVRLQSALHPGAQPQPQPQPSMLPGRGGLLALLGSALRQAAPALSVIAIVAVGLQAFLQLPQVIGIPEPTPGAMILTESAAPLPEHAPPIEQERADAALVMRADSPVQFDLADLAERNTRVRAPQKFVAPRMARRSYLLPPISGELIEDGVPIRPCGVCGQADGVPELPINPSGTAKPELFVFGPRPLDCAACAMQR